MGRFYVRGNEAKDAAYASPFDCPIARMLKRKFPNTNIKVAPTYILIGRKQYDILNKAGREANVKPHIEAGTGFHLTIKGLDNPSPRKAKPKPKKFRIAATWTMIDDFEVEANSLAEAVEKVYANDDNRYSIGNRGEYMDDSFNVSVDDSEEIA